jgi:ABC-type transport system involved in cytochrome c biogenesis permease subunit
MLKAGTQGLRGLLAGPVARGGQSVSYADGAFRMARLGFPVMTLGLVLGSVWGKYAWADYWHWDPKELWGLIMWLVYVVYFLVRRGAGGRGGRVECSIAVLGAVVIVVTVLWVNLGPVFAGLHSYAM